MLNFVNQYWRYFSFLLFVISIAFAGLIPVYLYSLLLSILPLTYWIYSRPHSLIFWFSSCLVFSLSMIIFILNNELSVFLYSIALLTLYGLIDYRFSYLNLNINNFKAAIFFIVFLVVGLALFYGIGERFRAWYGDPNFAASFLLSLIAFFFILGKNLKFNIYFHILLFSSMLLVLLLSGSRMAFLGVTFLLFFVFFKNVFLKKIATYFLIFLSIFLQYFIYLWVESTGLAVVGYAPSSVDRLTSFNDTSNLARVTAAYYAVTLFFDGDLFSILFGNMELFDSLKLNGYNIPHNYFLQFSLMYGFLYSLVILFFLIFLIHKSNENELSLIFLLVFMASVLSTVPIIILFIVISLLKVYSCNIFRSRLTL